MLRLFFLLIFCSVMVGIRAQSDLSVYPLWFDDGSMGMALRANNAISAERDYRIGGEHISFSNQGTAVVLDLDAADFHIIECRHEEGIDSIPVSFVHNDEVMVHAELNKWITAWSTGEARGTSFWQYAEQAPSLWGLSEWEVLSFIQQFYDVNEGLSKARSFADNVSSLRNLVKDSYTYKSCNCEFVLNHFSHMAPLDGTRGSYSPGYAWTSGDARFSNSIPFYKAFESSSRRWHRWKQISEGPAHEMFLRQYDSRRSFSYEWSTLGYDNPVGSTKSPNYAYSAIQFLCLNNTDFRPEGCECTKEVGVFYHYDVNLKGIARKLKPSAKVSSGAEEIALLTVENRNGVSVLDAGRGRVRTDCSGSFNFEWLSNLFQLAESVLETAVAIKDTTNGGVLTDIADNIDEVGQDLVDLVSTPAFTVRGTCNDVYKEATLMRGYQYIELEANDPTVVTMHSFSYLGTYGKKKWDNYATLKSDYRLQVIVSSDSKSNAPYCCSDKLTTFTTAARTGGGNQLENLTNIHGMNVLAGPWTRYSAPGYTMPIPRTTNRGYLVWENPNQQCAPTLPGGGRLPEEVDLEKRLEMFSNDNDQNTPKEIERLTLVIYPNPVVDELNIQITGVEGMVAWDVMDATGAVVASGNKRIERNASWSLLDDMEGLESGLYHITVRTKDGRFISKPCLIQ